MHNRQNALNQWLKEVLDSKPYKLTPLAGDASFRRYFRLEQSDFTRIVMDAPPEKETIEPFVSVTKLFTDAGIRTPTIYALDKTQGFILLDDFGDRLLLQELCPKTADKYYIAAMDTLIKLQLYSPLNNAPLPLFDKPFILQELTIFKEWFLQAYLQLNLTEKEAQLIDQTFDWLSDEISQQPKVIIHRDYHSRNIMVLPPNETIELGIIDYQDAMYGPFTYDLVSLLKDCYIQWPEEKILSLLSYFYNETTISPEYSLADFIKAFDYCGLQRHLKVLGVFSRLYLRDNKPNYLQDLPLTLHYVMTSLKRYECLQPFYLFMQNRINLP